MLKFIYIFLLFFMYSVLGYIIECIFCSIIDKKKVINRGFLIGPYLPIYGNGALIMIFFLKKHISYPITLFIMGAVVATILEYVTSYFMEKLFKARWWDYSDKKYNLNGRICIENTVLFGIGCLLIMYVVNPFFTSILDSMSNSTLLNLGIIFFIIYLTDTIISILVVYKLRTNRINLLKDSTEEISEKVKETLRKNRVLKKRLLNAFPKIKTINPYDKIKKILEKYI